MQKLLLRIHQIWDLTKIWFLTIFSHLPGPLCYIGLKLWPINASIHILPERWQSGNISLWRTWNYNPFSSVPRMESSCTRRLKTASPHAFVVSGKASKEWLPPASEVFFLLLLEPPRGSQIFAIMNWGILSACKGGNPQREWDHFNLREVIRDPMWPLIQDVLLNPIYYW